MDLFDDAGGDLRARYEAVDWTQTSLGPRSTWTPTLRSAIRLTLGTRFAVTLLWGPEFVLIYNVAYAEIIADKHPDALGRPAAEVFPEAWDVVGPMLRGVRDGDGANWVENLAIPLVRRDALSEAYFTFSYSPVSDSAGTVEGVIDITAETTGTVVASRRLRLLGRLEVALADAGHVAEIVRAAELVLRAAIQDFADVRSVPALDGAPEVERAGRVFRVGFGAGSALTSLALELNPLVTDDDATVEFVRLIAATLTRAADRVVVREADAAMSEALQLSLLPKPILVSDGIDVVFGYRPAGHHSQIGGDWYDAFRLTDGSTMLVVGDVMGHDRQAAVVMGELRNLLRGVAGTTDGRPSTVLATLDNAMRDLAIDALATVIVARIAPGGDGPRDVVWSSAGHLPPLLRRGSGAVESLEAKADLMLGVDADAVRTDHDVVLDGGDALLLYTDGLIERRDRSIDDGVAALSATWRDAPSNVRDQLGRILGEHANSGEDDVALVIAQVESGP